MKKGVAIIAVESQDYFQRKRSSGLANQNRSAAIVTHMRITLTKINIAR